MQFACLVIIVCCSFIWHFHLSHSLSLPTIICSLFCSYPLSILSSHLSSSHLALPTNCPTHYHYLLLSALYSVHIFVMLISHLVPLTVITCCLLIFGLYISLLIHCIHLFIFCDLGTTFGLCYLYQLLLAYCLS